jgi:hypothetical protein
MRRLPSPLALGLPAVLALVACGPSIDPAAKADLDRRIAELQTSQETFPPSESFLPMPFIPGQWTQHTVRDAKGNTSLLTYKLLGQESGGYWLEILNESYYGREVAKLQVFLLNGRDPSGMEIRALKVKKGNAAPVDVNPTAASPDRDRYRHALDLLAVAFEGKEKDDARVPAGHFIGCWKHQTPTPWGPWQTPTILCAHPSVPLSGVVRAVPTGGSEVLELVSFGTTGAEGEL